MYDEDENLCIGTLHELAKYRGMQPQTIQFYMSDSQKRRSESCKRLYRKGEVLVVRLDDDDEEGWMGCINLKSHLLRNGLFRGTTINLQRMGGITTKKRLRKVMLEATDKELGLRANYMLLFSIHGRPGDTPNTEVRYYFDWDLVIDNKKKTIIILYQCEVNRRIPAWKFGDPKLRKKIYNCWFKQRVMETDASI